MGAENQEEQKNFQNHESYFYNIKNISNYVTYEDSKLIKKININGGKGLKIVKRYKINKEIYIDIKKIDLPKINISSLQLKFDVWRRKGNRREEGVIIQYNTVTIEM